MIPDRRTVKTPRKIPTSCLLHIMAVLAVLTTSCSTKGLVAERYAEEVYRVPKLLPDEPNAKNPAFILYGDVRPGYRLHEKFLNKDNWYTKFNRTFDPIDTGIGHSIEDTVAFRSPDASTLLEYHRAVLEQSKRYITSKLSETELNREFDKPKYPTITNVRTSLMRLINDNMQHLGQINYVRGMLKGWGWLGR